MPAFVFLAHVVVFITVVAAVVLLAVIMNKEVLVTLSVIAGVVLVMVSVGVLILYYTQPDTSVPEKGTDYYKKAQGEYQAALAVKKKIVELPDKGRCCPCP